MTDGLNKNADGTLTITIQEGQLNNTSNWLPRRGTVQSYHAAYVSMLDGSLLNAP
jgi:hypothetical protein